MRQNKDNMSEYLRDACDEMKQMVGKVGPDGTPGLLDAWTSEDYFNVLNDNLESFTEYTMTQPFFKDKHYSCLYEVYQQGNPLFMYCLMTFLTEKLVNGCIGNITVTDPNDSLITIDDKDALLTTTVKDDEKENKKQLVKEVMNTINRKQSLNDFLKDIDSYKQFRDDIDQCLLYEINFENIHKVMEVLDWEWASWIDEDYNEHECSTPSVFGIKENLIKKLKDMEEWIRKNPEAKEYNSSCGGWEINMHMVEDLETEDDYENQVRFTVKFVAEYFDNGM